MPLPKVTPLNSKVVIFGDYNVGKTSLLIRFLKNDFRNCGNTIGASYNVWRNDPYQLNGKLVQNVIGFWDTAGQERFESILPVYLRQADAIIFCWDSSRRLNKQELQRRINVVNSVNNTAKWFFVFTKTDVSENIRDIDAEDIVDKELNTFIYYTSSKENIGVDKLFKDIIDYVQSSDKITVENLPREAFSLTEQTISTARRLGSCFGLFSDTN